MTACIASPCAIPMDASQRGLDALRDPEHLRKMIAGASGGNDVGGVSLRMIRHVPGKRTLLRADALIAGSRRTLLLKVFSKPHWGARAHNSVHQLWQAGFADAPYLVCEPLGYDPTEQIAFFGWAPGTPLRRLFSREPDCGPQYAMAGSWLAKLHNSGVTEGRRYGLSRHLRTLDLQKHLLADAYPSTEKTFDGVLTRLAARAGLTENIDTGPTHRDFSPDHLLYRTGSVTAIDFDEFCQYHPLFDVVHFVAHVRVLALVERGSLEAANGLLGAFLSGYGLLNKGEDERLYRLLSAAAYLKLAYIAGAVHRGTQGEEVAKTLLKEAKRCALRC